MLIALCEFASVLSVDLSVFKRVYAVKKGVRFFLASQGEYKSFFYTISWKPVK